MSIVFKAALTELGPLKIVRLPMSVSGQLPSRGMVMVEGTVNGQAFVSPAEPDGKGSHWLEISGSLQEKAKGEAGQPLQFDIRVMDEWPEPQMLEDIIGAIDGAGLTGFWQSLTVKAKWDWLRWIRATNNPATRAKHIEVAVSKMRQGDRRPCCFNSATCTVAEVSKGGVLLD